MGKRITETWKEEVPDHVDATQEQWDGWGYDKQRYHDKRKEERKRHNKRRIERRKWAKGIKEDKECLRCGEEYSEALDWHHINSDEKDGNVMDMAGQGYSKDRIHDEIEKCVILCANCHRKLHGGVWDIKEVL